MLLHPRPTSLSPHPRSSSFTFFTPSVITQMNASSAPTSPLLLKRSSMNENVPPTPINTLHSITVVSVASHPLPQQQAVRIDMKLRIPISLFTPTQQAALAAVKQREMAAMRKRKRSECTLKGCTCVSCKEEPMKEDNIDTMSETSSPPPEIVSIASATSAFKKLKSTSTPSSPPSKSTSSPSSPSPYDDDHLSQLDLPLTFRNHKSWYANPFNTKKPSKPMAKIVKAIDENTKVTMKAIDENTKIVITEDNTKATEENNKDGESTTTTATTTPATTPSTSPPRHLSPPMATQKLTSPRTSSSLPVASIGLLSTDYVYRDVNVVIPATSSMDVAIQVHKHSVKIRCGGHTLVTLNAHHLFTF